MNLVKSDWGSELAGLGHGREDAMALTLRENLPEQKRWAHAVLDDVRDGRKAWLEKRGSDRE